MYYPVFYFIIIIGNVYKIHNVYRSYNLSVNLNQMKCLIHY